MAVNAAPNYNESNSTEVVVTCLKKRSQVQKACYSPGGLRNLQDSLREVSEPYPPCQASWASTRAVPQQPLGLVLFPLCREGRARSHF